MMLRFQNIDMTENIMSKGFVGLEEDEETKIRISRVNFAAELNYFNDFATVLDDYDKKKRASMHAVKELPPIPPMISVSQYNIRNYEKLFNYTPPEIGPKTLKQSLNEQLIELSREENAAITKKIQEDKIPSTTFTLKQGETQRIITVGEKKVEVNYKALDKLRIVDMPKELEKDQGPLLWELALQNANGRDMPKDTLYFKVQYNEEGKVTHISHPPVQFERDKCYCEVGREKFYLKVTKQKFEELSKEVEQKLGKGINTPPPPPQKTEPNPPSPNAEKYQRKEKRTQEKPVTTNKEWKKGKGKTQNSTTFSPEHINLRKTPEREAKNYGEPKISYNLKSVYGNETIDEHFAKERANDESRKQQSDREHAINSRPGLAERIDAERQKKLNDTRINKDASDTYYAKNAQSDLKSTTNRQPINEYFASEAKKQTELTQATRAEEERKAEEASKIRMGQLSKFENNDTQIAAAPQMAEAIKRRIENPQATPATNNNRTHNPGSVSKGFNYTGHTSNVARHWKKSNERGK